MDNNKLLEETSEFSFEFAYLNDEGVLISFGPEGGLLWRGEKVDPSNLLVGLYKVFQDGFTQTQTPQDSVLATMDYLKKSYPGFICASSLEPMNRINEKILAGKYGYLFLIDSVRENKIKSIPLCKENISNQNFVNNSLEEITEAPEYAIIAGLNEKNIIGAIPSNSIANELKINTRCFIKNPKYEGGVVISDDFKYVTDSESVLELLKANDGSLYLQTENQENCSHLSGRFVYSI